MEAVDGNYPPPENVKVSHINGGLADLTPRFENLKDGQVIKQGETLGTADLYGLNLFNLKDFWAHVHCSRLNISTHIPVGEA